MALNRLFQLFFPVLALAPASLFGAQPTSIVLQSSSSTAEYGHPLTLTAAVAPRAATGEVTFYNGTALLETAPLVNGKAAVTTVLLPSGTLALRAYYGGSASFAPSGSATLKQTITPGRGTGFQSVVNYPAGSVPDALAIGDFNGDNRPDVVTADSGGPGVTVLLSNSDGTLRPGVSYATGAGPFSVAVADFNGDGKADLVVANSSSDTVSVLLGNGDGTFQAKVDYAAGPSPGGIAVGDFNGDGKADVVAPNTGGNVIELLGNGDGTLQPGVSFFANQDPSAIAVADFDADGKADLAVANSDGGFLTVLLGNGDGTFGAPLNTGFGTAVTIGDFNGDGKADLAIANDFEGSFSVLLGNGDGTFQAPVLTYLDGISAFAVADFNADGKADLFAASRSNTVSLLLGNGDGTFQPEVNYNFGASAESYAVAAADFNGDGAADVAVVNLNGGIGIFLATTGQQSGLTLFSSQNPSTFGHLVTLSATLAPLNATGTVSFYQGTAGLAKIPISNGMAALPIDTLPAGADSIQAIYNGDAALTKSVSPVLVQTVKKAYTYTGLTSSPDPSSVGQSVVLTATVAPITATGTVTFYAPTTLGSSALNGGTATLTIAKLPAGKHALTAVYNGDANHVASASPVRIQTVNPAAAPAIPDPAQNTPHQEGAQPEVYVPEVKHRLQ